MIEVFGAEWMKGKCYSLLNCITSFAMSDCAGFGQITFDSPQLKMHTSSVG